MSAESVPKGILLVAIALLVPLTAGVVAQGEVYAFILVGDGNFDVLGQNPERGAFYSAASRIDNAFKSGWSIEPPNIAFVQAWENSATDLYVRLSSLTSGLNADDVFIFYYVGHGSRTAMMPWGEGEDKALLGYDYFRQVPGTKVLILDSCYAGVASGEVGADTWVVASCGEDETRKGSVYESPFSVALATAISGGATGVRAAFENAEHVWWYGQVSKLGQTPHLWSPADVGRDDDLDIAEAAAPPAPAITSLAVSGSITGVTGVSASGVAAGSASCNVTLELDSVSGEYRASCDYSVQADPARGRGSAHVSIRIVVPILPPLGSIELHASMDAEGAVQYGVFPNAQSDYAPGTMQGDIVIGGVRASFTGSGQMQGHTSGTSAQDVEVTLWFDMEADL